ncbi:MAG: molybdopterin-dependent oxidoreductase, partial [Nitrospinaceae bacterium]|nr:molybdopterin-dependent oxidoreductase [Nitrospinaceae bacterium]NIR54229.1 molybdopterin-dependent oxidoreductase [Nitrospinaceae bacterium]NIS84644.1 molybdopterin-dependent oxidoreductase [Nitrospinaceae bacterium]NIT81439.1 molybdopterin-dependent oxidoreductase [Nitrospinaceae bacterium]NIU43722.1 molybdopterin-dependent oxidoreductase [Nitrospinaceae bacterium]
MKGSQFGFHLDRRTFLKLCSLATGSLLAPPIAGARNGDFRNDKNIPQQYVQNRDIPGFYIRSANPFLGVDIRNWGLAVGGQVKNPVGLGYEDLFGFKMHSQVSRLKCVECWSAKAEWEGFLFQELIDRVQPDPAAQYVYFQSADSYYESYTVDEL